MAGSLPWAGSPKESFPVVPVPMALAHADSAYSPSPAACGMGSSHAWGQSLNTSSQPRLQHRNRGLWTIPTCCGTGSILLWYQVTRARAAVGIMGPDVTSFSLARPPTSQHHTECSSMGTCLLLPLPGIPLDTHWLFPF